MMYTDGNQWDDRNEAVERGCGTRIKGGVYVETMTGPNGHPIECFIKDQPLALNVEAIGLSHIGVKLIERDGVTYIFDWIGEGYYPNVADFIEEVRRFGASRRLPPGLDFAKLSPNSKLVLVHSRAKFELTPAMRDNISTHFCGQGCPRMVKAMHDNQELSDAMGGHNSDQCARSWWYDLDAPSGVSAGTDRTVEMPSLSYRGITRVEMPSYLPAIFLVLPIHRVVVVRDDETESHEDTYEKISSSLAGQLPLELVDE